jgi:hypothetical protein
VHGALRLFQTHVALGKAKMAKRASGNSKKEFAKLSSENFFSHLELMRLLG